MFNFTTKITEPYNNKKFIFLCYPRDRIISYLIVYCDLVYLGIMALRPCLQGPDQGIHGGAGYQGSNYSPPFLQSHPDNLK